MSRLLLLSTALLGASEAVTVELLRLFGTMIAAAAALCAAYWARQGRQHAAGARREARSRRLRVRHPESGEPVVLDVAPPIDEHEERVEALEPHRRRTS